MSAEKDKLALLRQVSDEFGNYLKTSRPLEPDVHKRIEVSIKLFNQALKNADEKKNDSKAFARIDTFYNMFVESKCHDAKSFAAYYIETKIFPQFVKIYRDESPVNVVEDSKPKLSDMFLGTKSIKDNLDRLSKLTLEQPSRINWAKLYSDGLIHFDSSFSVLTVPDDLFDESGHCLLSYDEWLSANECDKVLSKLFSEYVWHKKYAEPLRNLLTDRSRQIAYFLDADTEEKKTNIRFTIDLLDKAIGAYL